MSEEGTAALRLIEPGFGASLQDLGRFGWRRFGVPVSGCMDPHAAECANRLLENERSAAVLEILFGGARFEVLQDMWIAVTGAAEANIPGWRAYRAVEGEVISFLQAAAGVWAYLAVEGGFAAPKFFGSTSYYARAELGMRIAKGTVLERNATKRLALPAGVSGRAASWEDQRDYSKAPVIRVSTGPQWKSFSVANHEKFLSAEWTVKPQSDRVGYRLGGPVIIPHPAEIISEAVRIGSVQVPENGQPIVTMRDGPTVGGYPKIALVDEDDLPWVAQSRPGQTIRFQLVQ
jgi:antagonist of KipI